MISTDMTRLVTVVVSGQQGSVKTSVADLLSDALIENGFNYTIIDGEHTKKGFANVSEKYFRGTVVINVLPESAAA